MIRLLVIRLLLMGVAALVATVGLLLAFDALFDDGPFFAFALTGGALIGVAAGLLRNSIDWLARRRLLSGASGRADGTGRREVALRGRIVAREAPLHLPFADGPLVAAQYAVTAKGQDRLIHGSKGSSANSDHVHMAGLVAVPCALRIEGVDIALHGFPSPADFPEEKRPAAPLAASILSHAATPGIMRDQGFSPADALAVLDSYSHNSGAGQIEEFAVPSLPDIVTRPDALVKLQAIPEGAEVCVIATYDPAAGRLVANVAWGGIGLYPGDAAQARNDMGRRAIRSTLLAAALAGFATFGLGGIIALVQPDDATRMAELQSNIQYGRIDAARQLLERGLVIDPTEMEQMVAEAPNGPTLALLAQFGADLDGRDAEGLPLLIAAAMRGDMERLRDLLEAGASPDMRGGPGYLSALEWAADRGDVFMASFLQEQGVPGQVAVQSGLHLIEDAAHPAFVALRGLYEAPTPFPHADGFGPEDRLKFEGGLGDADIVTLYINNTIEVRAHVMQRRGNDWALLRITPIDQGLN